MNRTLSQKTEDFSLRFRTKTEQCEWSLTEVALKSFRLGGNVAFALKT